MNLWRKDVRKKSWDILKRIISLMNLYVGCKKLSNVIEKATAKIIGKLKLIKKNMV